MFYPEIHNDPLRATQQPLKRFDDTLCTAYGQACLLFVNAYDLTIISDGTEFEKPC